MEERDSVFDPGGRCETAAGWAVLLHALAIGPSTMVTYRENGISVTESIVSYKPVSLDTQIAFLEIPGDIICHILNLHGSSYAQFGMRSDEHQDQTEFGSLAWRPSACHIMSF
jgi:hypothetical protein